MNNAAHYLRDLEKVITLYGITKPRQSQKVKMLHSIYLYLRVLTGGTILPDRDPNYTPMGEEESGPDSGPSLYRRFSTWDKLMQEPPHTHDIMNLDFMQCLVSPKSTFEQIYSVPETLFKFIFETTELAREAERLRALHRRATHTDHDEFATKVKKLENNICEWEHEGRQSCNSMHLPSGERFPYHLVQAIYAALMIYFYRCVRDVNAVVLQPYVQQTIYHLTEFDKQKERSKDQSSHICWPWFIAGCEATRPQTRQQISEWLERFAKHSRMRMFSVALKAIRKVWAARSLPGKQNLSWGSILGEFNDLRVLVLS